MVETVEIKQPETTSEQPVEEKSTQSKPEGLPEKFNSVEDLAKSYSELEKKLGEQTPTEEVDPTSKATLKEDAPKEQKGELGNALDIGAHVGFWLKDMCKEFKQVYAFEPINAVRDCIHHNVTADNYKLLPYGLSSKEGIVKVMWNENETGNTFVSDTGNTEIEVKRLDDYF